MPYSDFTKSPLYQLRFPYHFDIPQLIRAAGLPHISDLFFNPFDRALYGLPVQRVYADKILLGLRQLTGKDFTYEDLGIALEDESLPTFQEARVQHSLTIVQIAANAALPIATVERIDEKGEGTLTHIMKAVASLSQLSGMEYKLYENIRGFLYLKE
ncbi:MAG: hypothetical protein E6J34_01090 [Chloroflexi bacterium]|nr:MAG: hypothetical protein E6J34_01090 [Chloroflexota bacterium]